MDDLRCLSAEAPFVCKCYMFFQQWHQLCSHDDADDTLPFLRVHEAPMASWCYSESPVDVAQIKIFLDSLRSKANPIMTRFNEATVGIVPLLTFGQCRSWKQS